MAINERWQQFHGTQEAIFRENGDVAARITAVAQTHLSGAHFMVEHGKSVHRESLGLGIVQMGLAVLVMADSISPEVHLELKQLVEEAVLEYAPTSPDDNPF